MRHLSMPKARPAFGRAS